MSGLVALKFLGVGVLLGASLLAVAVGLALLMNRKGLADRVRRHEERDVVDWPGPISLLHHYFNRVVRFYALGLIAWGAFFPGAVVSIWLGPHPGGVASGIAAASFACAAVAFLGMFAIALAMGMESERAMGALGLPLFTPGRLKSAPWQANATFWAAIGVGVAVDVLMVLAWRSG
jgi:hypothetical protein